MRSRGWHPRDRPTVLGRHANGEVEAVDLKRDIEILAVAVWPLGVTECRRLAAGQAGRHLPQERVAPGQERLHQGGKETG